MEERNNQEMEHNQEFEEEKKNTQDIEEEKDNQEIEEEENIDKIKDAGTIEDRLNKKRMLIISAIATAIGLFIVFSFFSDVIFGLFHHPKVLKPKETSKTLAPKLQEDWKTMTDMKISQLQNQINQLQTTNQQLLQTIQQQQKQQQQQQQQQNLKKLISPPPSPPPARMPHYTRMPRFTPPPPPPPPPPMNYNNNQGPMMPPQPQPQPKPTLKVFKAKQTAFKQTKGVKGVSATAKKVIKKEKIRIPLGFLRGLTLTGLDAPTFQYGQNNPEPVLIVSLSRQILADNKRLNLKGCFFLGSGYGEISSERAYIRLVKISCIDNKGHVLEQKVHGWVFDADGKVGLRGRVVSKQGAVLAKTFMAGLLQGISSILSASSMTTQVSPIGTTQTISPSEVSKVAVASGFESAAAQLAQFYMKIAEQMYPVVEIKPGRKVTILIDEGSLEKSDKDKLVSNPLR